MTEKILYVDDDANSLAAFQRQFRHEFQIDTAPSGVDGLQAIAGLGPYAVIVADMVMPGMNGIESKGQTITVPLVQRLKRLSAHGNLKQQTIRVKIGGK